MSELMSVWYGRPSRSERARRRARSCSRTRMETSLVFSRNVRCAAKASAFLALARSGILFALPERIHFSHMRSSFESFCCFAVVIDSGYFCKYRFEKDFFVVDHARHCMNISFQDHDYYLLVGVCFFVPMRNDINN